MTDDIARKQCRELLRHFKKGGTVTRLEAMQNRPKRFTKGIGNLPQRVAELRDAGWPVVMEWEETKDGRRYGRYRLADDKAA